MTLNSENTRGAQGGTMHDAAAAAPTSTSKPTNTVSTRENACNTTDTVANVTLLRTADQTIDKQDLAELSAKVQNGLMRLFVKQCRLYTCGGSSSITSLEAHDLLDSIRFVLRAHDLEDPATLARLASDDMDTLFHQGLQDINRRVDDTMELWNQVCLTMPPIKNIALRDTLASIGQFRKVYDTYFAAFAVPVSIDYPLHDPVPETLQGVDYVHEWLRRCLKEAQYIAQFDTKECIAVLKRACPDYKGLLINLYEPIHRHFGD